MKTLFICVALIISALYSYAQTKPDTLTNKTVIQLKQAGLSASVIKTKIENSVCTFDLSTDALIALKKANVHDDVITAMLSKKTTVDVTASTKLSDTVQAMSPGIYLCKGTPCEYTELEASVYSQAKTGSGILTALTYGAAKTKMKASLSGTKANLQVQDAKPIFYFHFDKNNGNGFGTNGTQSLWFSSATSPNEFLLVRFDVSKKSREVVTGSWNSYAGLSSGIDDQHKVSFKYEKIAHGVYKVYAEQTLLAGEYCFMYAGGTATYGAAPLQKVYDFGVK